jgi:hypothetical protein
VFLNIDVDKDARFWRFGAEKFEGDPWSVVVVGLIVHGLKGIDSNCFEFMFKGFKTGLLLFLVLLIEGSELLDEESESGDCGDTLAGNCWYDGVLSVFLAVKSILF